MASTWEAMWYALAPRWLRDTESDKIHTVLGGIVDVLRLGAVDATKCGLVTECPQDAVWAHARTRMIEPLQGETVEALRMRTADAWDHWGDSGTTAGLEALLSAYMGTADIAVLDVVNNASDQFFLSSTATNWSCLWVAIGDDAGYRPPTVGAGLTVGPSLIVGIDMTLDELSRIRRIFARYRPAHCVGAGIWVNVTSNERDITSPGVIYANAADFVLLPLHVVVAGFNAPLVGPGLVVGHVYH
jgi:hypothetical protein